MQTIPLAEAWARLAATEPPERLDHWRTRIDWPAPDAPVLWHEGDLALPLLDLACLGERALPPQGPVPLLCVRGRLLLGHALLGSAEGQPPVHLLVTGDLQTGDALLGPGLVAVGGALQVQGLLWGQGPHGQLQTSGAVQARCALFSQGYQATLPNARIDWWIDTQAQGDAPGADPTGYRAEALAAQLYPEGCAGLATLWPEATSTPASAPAPLPDASRLLRAPALRTRALRGEPLLQPAEALPGLFAPQALPAAAVPLINIATIRTLVDGPLLTRRQQRLQDWFGDIDYALCRRHVDASGQQHEDSVFITVWRQWDFFLQAARVPRPRHLGMRLAARLGLHEPPLEDVLTLLWRHPDAEGEGPWSTLDANAPAEAHAASAAAWQAVQAHVAEGLAQARAGLPLWGWMQRQLTPERVQALTELPVFTERYNDWWHSDRNGFWEGDLWVGARQPGLRGTQRTTRALKLSWAQGRPRPEDAEDNHLASYLLEFDTGSDGRPWLRMGSAQRQDSERQPLPHHSAAHLLRLVRLFTAIDTGLHQREAQARAAEAEIRHLQSLVRLRAHPPVPEVLADEEVFAPEVLALSPPWQAWALQGGPAPSTDAQRSVLLLARNVHRSRDAGLARRLRARFPFTPALPWAQIAAPRAVDAAEAPRPARVGAVLIVGPERVLVRQDPDANATHTDAAQWWLLSGMQPTPLPRLRAAGRSADGRFWALCEDGDEGGDEEAERDTAGPTGTASPNRQITTRAGLDGPPIAHFTLPTPTATCLAVLPLDEGQRVLLQDTHGIHLLQASGPQCLRPGPATHLTLAEDGRSACWQAADGSHWQGGFDGPPPAAIAMPLVPTVQQPALHPLNGRVTAFELAADGRWCVLGTDAGYVVALESVEATGEAEDSQANPPAGEAPAQAFTPLWTEAWRWLLPRTAEGPQRW